MSISWKPWASLITPSPADAHDERACGAQHHEVTAAGGSSIIEFAGAAPRRPKTCPNATRNACAFRSHSPANFEFPRQCRRPRRGAHHEHQRDPRDGNGGPPLKASRLRLRQAPAATEGRRLEPEALKSASAAGPFCGGPPLPPTLLRHVAGVPLMLVMRAPAGSPARTRKLEISW